MKKINVLSLLLLIAFSSQAFAGFPPKTDRLYREVAKNCTDANVKTLKKDQIDFLEEHQFKIKKIQLCNNKEFPVYIGNTQYDLTYQNNKAYAQKFFKSLADLNNKQSFAVVDFLSHKIFYVNSNKSLNSLSYTVEFY